jgi:hypothetical protein
MPESCECVTHFPHVYLRKEPPSRMIAVYGGVKNARSKFDENAVQSMRGLGLGSVLAGQSIDSTLASSVVVPSTALAYLFSSFNT